MSLRAAMPPPDGHATCMRVAALRLARQHLERRAARGAALGGRAELAPDDPA